MFEQLLGNRLGKPLPIIPDNGPGPASLIQYDEANDTGYFGTLPLSDLFTIEAIEAKARTPLPGAPSNRDVSNRWIKAYSKGKVIYMPIKTVRTGTSWNDIYNAGFVYGVDGTGLYPPTTGSVNQLVTIDKTSADNKVFTFKVRMIQGYAIDGFTTPLVQSDIANSEYSLIRERLTGSNANAPATWATLGSPVGLTYGIETSADGQYGIVLNNRVFYLDRITGSPFTKANASYCNFYPIVELISVTKP